MSKPRKPVAEHTWCDRNLMVSPVYYTLCTSEAAFHAEMARLGTPRDDWPRWLNSRTDSGATCHFLTHPENQNECAIVCVSLAHVIANKRTPIQIAALLVHEAVHIWQHVKEIIGEHTPGSEQEAYAVQWISQELFEEWAKALKKA